jgi:hypothetical protein
MANNQPPERQAKECEVAIMRLMCVLGRHKAPSPYFTVREGDTWFGECPYCSEQIIRRDGSQWEEVPAGQRVVWVRDKPTIVERKTQQIGRRRFREFMKAAAIRIFLP